MKNEYYSIVTNVGTQKIAEAINNDSKVNIVEFAVGDGGGAYYKPTPIQKGLKNEMWRGSISACYINENSENVLVIESVIPSNVGGYTIREMAVFDEEGNMIAICNTPDTQKVDISDGVIHELDLSLEIAVTNTESIQLVIDPNVINATKKDVRKIEEKVNRHIENNENPHYVTKEQVGLGNVDNTADIDKPVSVLVREALDAYYAQLTAYADKKIADLIDGAPTTMDTLKEVHDAIEENRDIQIALDAAIGTKTNKNEFDSHVATGASKAVLGHVKVDDALSTTSSNPVQNKIVKVALDGKANTSHTHNELWEKVYPVGAIYLSTVNTSPATLFGGKWEQITSGYLRAGTSYTTKTDGSNTATGAASGNTGSTTLTAAQSGVPAHAHTVNHSHNIYFTTIKPSSGSNYSVTLLDGTQTAPSQLNNYTGATASYSGNTGNNTGASASSGHTHTLNSHTHPINLNYVQVYMWKRTA